VNAGRARLALRDIGEPCERDGRPGPVENRPHGPPRSPLVRHLVAVVRSVGVLLASAEIVGRRASLVFKLLLATRDYEAPTEPFGGCDP
jgi:hypothetical protein